MAPDEERGSRPQRRRHDGDEGRDDGRSERRRHRDSPRDSDRHERRRSRDRRDRRRSRTPESSRARSRSRDRDRHRRRRSRDDKDRGRDRDADGRDSRKRRHRHEEDADEQGESSRRSPLKRGGPLPSQEASFAVTTGEEPGEPEKPKEKPNFGNTGVLAAASNSVVQADGSSITLKYHEPAEARKPPARDQWKLFIFKGDETLDTIDLGARSCWLVGREMAVVDLPAEHPSISKQHAVIQFRYTEKRNEFGDKIGRVKPYLIDLESANGTILNGNKIPDSRYLELRDKDIVQFGQSAREYVFMLAPRD